MPFPQPRRSSDSRRSGGPRGGSRFDNRRRTPDVEERKGWGSVARKGAASVRDDDRRSSDRFVDERSVNAPERLNEVWVRDEEPQQVKRSSQKGERFKLPDEAIAELRSHVGAKRSERLSRYLRDAASAYAAERWSDSRRALKVLLAEAPDVATVKELNAMLLYRTGKYSQAVDALRDAHLATLSFDLYPAMMDSCRALKKYDDVADSWEELRAASPSAEVMAEGRIVMAGALADQDRLVDAIALLNKAPRAKRKIGLHHLRTWYVLGDLYDRSGEVGRARAEFQRIVEVDEGFADCAARLENLA